MNRARAGSIARGLAVLSLALLPAVVMARATMISLDRIADLRLVSTRAAVVKYQGRSALQLLPVPGHENDDRSLLAVIPGTDFEDGTIELDVAGAPRPGSPPASRGFIGIAFHVQASPDTFECFYIRPTNGRADDQLRRNHSLQYVSSPDFPWPKLRQEAPGVYESYADLESGTWTHLKVEVAGTKARLYVEGTRQPALIVNDLKLGATRGSIALWANSSTLAYFANLQLR